MCSVNKFESCLNGGHGYAIVNFFENCFILFLRTFLGIEQILKCHAKVTAVTCSYPPDDRCVFWLQVQSKSPRYSFKVIIFNIWFNLKPIL